MYVVGHQNFAVIRKRGNDAVAVIGSEERSFCRHGEIPLNVGINLAELIGNDNNFGLEFAEETL